MSQRRAGKRVEWNAIEFLRCEQSAAAAGGLLHHVTCLILDQQPPCSPFPPVISREHLLQRAPALECSALALPSSNLWPIGQKKGAAMVTSQPESASTCLEEDPCISVRVCALSSGVNCNGPLTEAQGRCCLLDRVEGQGAVTSLKPWHPQRYAHLWYSRRLVQANLSDVK